MQIKFSNKIVTPKLSFLDYNVTKKSYSLNRYNGKIILNYKYLLII